MIGICKIQHQPEPGTYVNIGGQYEANDELLFHIQIHINIIYMILLFDKSWHLVL